jgi:hypothetical protein
VVELDYIFEAVVLQRECQRPDILSDTDLKYDLVMPTRLQVGGTEILALTETEYQTHAFRDRLPSAAWDFIPVLMIAAFVDTHFRRLREQGYSDIIFLDPDLRLTLHGDIVTVSYFYSGAPHGEARYDELYSAFVAFGERVRRDFLSVCPILRDYEELGVWFKYGVAPNSMMDP